MHQRWKNIVSNQEYKQKYTDKNPEFTEMAKLLGI